MLTIQLGLDEMERHGGVIVNISSVAGIGSAAHDLVEYAVAKAGIVRLTSALKSVMADTGVRINTICPDLVDTPSSRRDRATMSQAELDALPPVLTPQDIAEGVMHFIEDDARAGETMVYRGGQPPYLLAVPDYP